MIKVKKKQGKIVQAYKLGDEHPVLDNLMKEKKIINMQNGIYEVFSQETVKSESGHGQLASAGDWVRLDGAGFPYPSKNEWFKENLRHINGDDYEQIPKQLKAWTANQDICPEIQFLIKEKGLVLDEENPEKFYNAILWGNPEAAAKDAVLVFYNITYGEDGKILDIDYNFVERKEFDFTYDVLQ